MDAMNVEDELTVESEKPNKRSVPKLESIDVSEKLLDGKAGKSSSEKLKHGITVSWYNLTAQVQKNGRFLNSLRNCCDKNNQYELKTTKILRSACGLAEPGEMLAIMGGR